MRGQESAQGYAMAALLVGLSIMAVMLTVVMPVWKQDAQREKEAELVFRGQQYVRAVGLFQRKNGPGTLPPTIDILVDQKFLRKKFKDPITNDDFLPLTAGQVAGPGGISGNQPGAARPGATVTPASGTPGPAAAATPTGSAPRPGGPGASGPIIGGIMGVVSKSKDKSIRLFNGRSHYNEWQFVFVAQTQAPGAGGAAGTAAPGQGSGQQPTMPGGGVFGGGNRGGTRGGPGRGGPERPGGPGGQRGPFGPGGMSPTPNQPRPPR